jgi:hypothetical protein
MKFEVILKKGIAKYLKKLRKFAFVLWTVSINSYNF